MLKTEVQAVNAVEVFEPLDWFGIRGIYGNVRIRELHFQKGQIIPGHKHNYAHAEGVVKGAVNVRFTWPDGRVSEQAHAAPAVFEVPAEVLHHVTCLSQRATVWCIFAVRDKEGGEIIEFIKAEHADDDHYTR